MKRITAAFLNSSAGLAWASRHEVSIRQEIALLAVGIPLSFVISPSSWQRVGLIGSIVFLMTIEMLNTAIEKLCDHVCPQRHPNIKVVKDLGSAAVFLAGMLTIMVWAVAIVDHLLAL